MAYASRITVALVSLIHLYILVLEMFLWQTDRGLAAFGMTPEFASQTAVLAANQGLYNGFLAAGLAWGLLHRDRRMGRQIQLFFLGCVAIAGVYGAITAKLSILFVQTAPALIASVFVLLAPPSDPVRPDRSTPPR